MKIYQPSKDETAFLYQQAFELEPFVKNLGSLTVLVEEVDNAKKVGDLEPHHFAVTFVVAPESMQFRVKGLGNSLVEATIAAKDEAHKQLSALMNAIPMDISGTPTYLH